MKLDPGTLKVQSFVTSLNGIQKNVVKGGDTNVITDPCCEPTGTNTGDPCYLTCCGTICQPTQCDECITIPVLCSDPPVCIEPI